MRLLVPVLFIFAGVPALAQETPLAKVYACSGITDAAQRLACFDAAVAGLKKQEQGGDLTVTSREAIEDAEVKAFGANAVNTPARPPAPSGAPPVIEAPDRVELAVADVSTTPDGKLRFVMENGQEWRQTDGVKVRQIGDGPWKAEIKKAALGSFMLKLDGKTAVRVKRTK